MADRIIPVESYGSSRIEPVRGYTAEQAARIIADAEKNSEEYLQAREYLKQFTNPEHKTFSELLDEALEGKNPVKTEVSEFGTEVDEAVDVSISEEGVSKSSVSSAASEPVTPKNGQIINLRT